MTPAETAYAAPTSGNTRLVFHPKPECELFGLERPDQYTQLVKLMDGHVWAVMEKISTVAADGKPFDQRLIILESILVVSSGPASERSSQMQMEKGLGLHGDFLHADPRTDPTGQGSCVANA